MKFHKMFCIVKIAQKCCDCHNSSDQAWMLSKCGCHVHDDNDCHVSGLHPFFKFAFQHLFCALLHVPCLSILTVSEAKWIPGNVDLDSPWLEDTFCQFLLLVVSSKCADAHPNAFLGGDFWVPVDRRKDARMHKAGETCLKRRHQSMTGRVIRKRTRSQRSFSPRTEGLR